MPLRAKSSVKIAKKKKANYFNSNANRLQKQQEY